MRWEKPTELNGKPERCGGREEFGSITAGMRELNEARLSWMHELHTCIDCFGVIGALLEFL